MAFSIGDFSQALTYGGARANLFKVTIPTPSALDLDGHSGSGAGTSSNKFQLNAKAATIPPSTIEPVEVPFYGRTFRLPGGRTFDDWETTVTNDEDFRVRDWMEQWSDAINGHSTKQSKNKSYAVDASVEQYSMNGDLIRKYIMIKAWPHTIGEITLDWSENGTIEEFPVTWAFDWWESAAMKEKTTDEMNAEVTPHIKFR